MKTLLKILLVSIFFSFISNPCIAEEDYFRRLPSVLKIKIFKEVPLEDLLNSAQYVSKEWNSNINLELEEVKNLKFIHLMISGVIFKKNTKEFEAQLKDFRYAESCLEGLRKAKFDIGFKAAICDQDHSLILDPAELTPLFKDKPTAFNEYIELWEYLSSKSPNSPRKFGIFVTLAHYCENLCMIYKQIQSLELKIGKIISGEYLADISSFSEI